jgi:uncharacterized protein (DUF2147 family)
LAASVFVVSSYAAPSAEKDIIGTWTSKVGSEITIRPCGKTLCGYITKVAVPAKIYRKHKKEIEEVGMQNLPDFFNKDPSLRNRPLRGLKVLTVVGQDQPNKFHGKLYNAEDGNTYEGLLTIHNPSRIELSGCVFFNMVCRGEVWHRSR